LCIKVHDRIVAVKDKKKDKFVEESEESELEVYNH